MNFYKINIEKLISIFNTNLQNGLTEKDIKERLKKYGTNSLPEKKNPTAFFIFLKQFQNPLIFILLLAVIISVLVSDLKESIVISLAVIVNIIFGFIQEWNTEKAFLLLKKLDIVYCNVLRDGVVKKIESKKLVPGDIILLEPGSIIPADIRLFNVIDFQVDEAILTGESKPIKKMIETITTDLPLADRINMAFSGTSVLTGKAKGIVVTTGINTEFGQINKLINQEDERPTPLQKQINKFSWWLASIFSIICISVVLIGLIHGIPLYEILITGTALAVAAIPEGLLIAVTVILAVGMQRMLKRNALIRHLSAAETLGNVSIICTDKTGTLTQGKMDVTFLATPNYELETSQILINDFINKEEVQKILAFICLNNDAKFENNSKIIGNPTETALLKLAQTTKTNITQIQNTFKRIDEIPFSSSSKFMATVHQQNNTQILIVKGATEKIFSMCKENTQLQKFKQIAENQTSNGLRLLAIATKQAETIDLQKDLKNLEMVGIIGIDDPLRPQAKDTIQELSRAGINIVLITGDHKETATKIAKNAGIQVKQDEVMTAIELDKISDEQLKAKINSTKIFARVEPKHKIRIVKTYQALGNSVAMVGDGLNDTPALKAADIGVALGSGSDVAHEISDMILLDNNLESIVKAVKEGRVIFDNLRKVIVFLLSHCFGEIILIILSIILKYPLPLTAAQILWINLMTHGLPHLALSVEPAEEDVMKNPPRQKNEPLISREMKTIIFGIVLITDLILFIFYIFLLRTNINFDLIRTIMFTSLSINSLFFLFTMRSFRRSIFKINIFSNPWIILAVTASFIFQLFVIYTPVMQKLFNTIPLRAFDWCIIIPIALIKAVAIEITKFVNNNFSLKTNPKFFS